jgi:bacterioferritin
MADNDLIPLLDEIHGAELTAALSFTAHAAELRHLGAVKLADAMQSEAVEELGHAAAIADRLYFLGGRPTFRTGEVSSTDKITDMVQRIVDMEREAVGRLNRAIGACVERKDAGTRLMLETILAEDELHLAEAQQMLAQIDSMGPQGYLMCICGGGVPNLAVLGDG